MSAAILERVRETLENALPRAQAAEVLFVALERFGPRIPSDLAELAGFVRGPLKDALSHHVQPRTLAKVIGAIEDVLSTADAPTADTAIPIELDAPSGWADEPSTAPVRAVEGPVPVLVVARSGSLASRLRMSLGDHAIDVETRGDRSGVERALGITPVLAVVDARDPGPIPVEALAAALAGARATTSILWGSDSPYGRDVIDAAHARGLELAGIATTEGLGAIFDLVISRRS